MYPANRDDILKGLADLTSYMEKLTGNGDQTSEDADGKLMEVRFKIMKQIVFQVDNSLGEFQDMLDTMEYHQDEKYSEAKALVAKLEDLTGDLVAYLRKHNQY